MRKSIDLESDSDMYFSSYASNPRSSSGNDNVRYGNRIRGQQSIPKSRNDPLGGTDNISRRPIIQSSFDDSFQGNLFSGTTNNQLCGNSFDDQSYCNPRNMGYLKDRKQMSSYSPNMGDVTHDSVFLCNDTSSYNARNDGALVRSNSYAIQQNQFFQSSLKEDLFSNPFEDIPNNGSISRNEEPHDSSLMKPLTQTLSNPSIRLSPHTPTTAKDSMCIHEQDSVSADNVGSESSHIQSSLMQPFNTINEPAPLVKYSTRENSIDFQRDSSRQHNMPYQERSSVYNGLPDGMHRNSRQNKTNYRSRNSIPQDIGYDLYPDYNSISHQDRSSADLYWNDVSSQYGDQIGNCGNYKYSRYQQQLRPQPRGSAVDNFGGVYSDFVGEGTYASSPVFNGGIHQRQQPYSDQSTHRQQDIHGNYSRGYSPSRYDLSPMYSGFHDDGSMYSRSPLPEKPLHSPPYSSADGYTSPMTNQNSETYSRTYGGGPSRSFSSTTTYNTRSVSAATSRGGVTFSPNYPSVYVPAVYETSELPAQEMPQVIVKGSPQYNVIKLRVDQAVELKRSRGVEASRQRLEELAKEFTQCHVVWIELSRLEMEVGNIKRCRDVVMRGLECLPGNETLLEKRVKVEERLRNVDGVVECAQQFLNTNNTRCVKSIVEAAIVVAKLGYGYQASDLFSSLIEHNMFTQGGVTLDYIRFVFKTEDYAKGLSMLKDTLTKLTKHGPMWFFTFSVLEQNHTVFWPRGDIPLRPYNLELKYYLTQALECLPDDLKWKVYYIAAQAQLRTFTHIRLWTRTKKRNLPEYCSHYPSVIRICFDYLRNCVLLCPNDYKWKVWLLAGRVQALAGKRSSAIKCLIRSTNIAPERSTHAVCLELARILDFIGDPVTAGEVININMQRFPQEWKLVLERIHQLLRENRVQEAYQLNKESLQYHLGAGRLWSSIIQLTHQFQFVRILINRLYGPTLALHVFCCALHYVAKSGEVWCEGARVFMNPVGRHFNPLNAQRCLNFAVYFTPQYGDSFIEAIRLSMITSEELILFGRSNNPCFLSAIMASRDYRPIINKCVYSDPNYGSCWFRAKLFPLGSAEEVVFRAIKFTAHEMAIVSNVYYDAMLRFARKRSVATNATCLRKKISKGLSATSTPFVPNHLRTVNVRDEQSKKNNVNCTDAVSPVMTETSEMYEWKNMMGVRNSIFSYSFQPYQMITTPSELTVGKKLKILFGTSQIEA